MSDSIPNGLLIGLIFFLSGVVTGICVRACGDEWRKAALSWKAAFGAWREVWRDKGPSR